MKNLLFLCLLAFAACQKVNDKNPKLIGSWVGSEWLIKDKPSGIEASQVHFDFADGTFFDKFGNQNEKGIWRTDRDRLFTKADDKEEIMVKILKLDDDTLRFEMNRGGPKRR